MEDMRYLTFALGKGRLANKTLETFEKIGITCEEMKDKDNGSNPKTGDNVMLYVAIASMSIIGLGATTIVAKKKKMN